MTVKTNFEEAKKAIAGIEWDDEAPQKYAEALIDLADSQRDLILSSANLSDEDILKVSQAMRDLKLSEAERVAGLQNGILVNNNALHSMDKLTKKAVEEVLETISLTEAQKKQVTATLLSKSANDKLAFSFKTLKANAIATAKAMLMDPMTWVSAAITGISLLVSWYEKTKQKAEETRQKLIEAADAAKDEADSIRELYDAYREADLAYKDNVGSKDALTSATDALLEKLGYEKSEIAELGQEYVTLENAINKVTKEALGKKAASILEGYGAAREDVLAHADDTNSWNHGEYIHVDKSGKNKKFYEYLKNGGYLDVDAALSASMRSGLNSRYGVNDVIESYERLIEIRKYLESGVGTKYTARELSEAKVYRQISVSINTMADAVENLSVQETEYAKIMARLAYMDYVEANGVPETREQYDALKKSLLDTAEASGKYLGTQDDIRAAIANTLAAMPDLQKIVNTSNDASAAVSTFKTQLSGLDDVFSALKSSYDVLASAESDMAGGGGLSYETIEKLSKAEEDYLDYLYEENGVVKLNTEAWKENANAKMLGEREDVQNGLDSLRKEKSDLEALLKEYQDKKLAALDAKDLSTYYSYDSTIDSLTERIQALAEAIADGQGELGILDAIFESITKNDYSHVVSFIEATTSSFQTLANLQTEVADGFTISIDKALEFAKVYPEIMKNAQIAADGQIALNADVVNAFIKGKKAELDAQIDAQIAMLEADAVQKRIQLEAYEQIYKKYADLRAGISEDVMRATGEVGMLGFPDFLSDSDLDISGYRDTLDKIDGHIAALKALKNASLDSFQSSSSSSGSGDASKEVEEYTAVIDKHREAIEALRKAQERVNDLESQTENAGSFEKKIALEEQLIQAYKDEQAALRNLNDARASTIAESVESLRALGFAVEYNADTNDLWISNLEHLNELTADSKGEYDTLQEATNALREDTEDLIETITGLNDSNRDGVETWRELRQSIVETTVSMYENAVQARQNAVALAENGLNNAVETQDLGNVKLHAAAIIAEYQGMQKTIHDEAEYYRSLGYADTSDEVSRLSDLWWEYADNIKAVKQQVVDCLIDMVEEAHGLVDEAQSVSDTLHDAANEFAANDGFISVDTYQAILELGPQYMQMLENENGLWEINEERINDVVAARTRQLAVENAMAYVERIKLAAQEGSIEDLNNLVFATTDAANSTWGLVYADLELMRVMGDLNDSQYQAALHNIQAMQDLAENAISGIGKVTGAAKDGLQNTLDELEKMQDGAGDLVDYVMDMLKHRTEQQVDLLEDMKDKYGEIIDLKKESLDATKDEQDYQKELSKKLKEMAKLQERINALSPDDSRKAQAERAGLLEEMAELQEELA